MAQKKSHLKKEKWDPNKERQIRQSKIQTNPASPCLESGSLGLGSNGSDTLTSLVLRLQHT